MHRISRSLSFGALTLCALSTSVLAQSGREMRVMVPAVIGQTAAFAMRYPTAIAGNAFLMLFAAPNYPGSLQLQLPGLTVNGRLRVDPATMLVLPMGVLDATGQSPSLPIAIPNDPGVVGFTFDVQGVDLSSAAVLTLSDNDVEVAVAALPGLNMVAIPAGTFQMGSNAASGLPYRGAFWERPVHPVTILRPLWIGKYEVTQVEWQAVMGSNPSYFRGSQLPVDSVTWNDALAFCATLTTHERASGRVPTGYQYRLPTEAEWEYCCRAGTTTEYSVGSILLCGQARFSFSYHSNLSCGSLQPWTVGGYVANGFGLHDMHGNVREWCLDSFDGSANYPAGGVTDPYVTSGSARVVRGGSWAFNSHLCRSAYRHSDAPDQTQTDMGFRVVLAPVLVQ